jgi:flagellar biogenesis protein FliO
MAVSDLLTDPVWLGMLAVLLLFVFFAYLLVRRTLLGLQDGYREGQRRN